MMEQERENPSIALLHERMSGNLLLLGLTGGIASGKSTVTRFFQDVGVPVIDADQVARDVVQPGRKAFQAIVERFGPEILQEDRQIDRIGLGSIVFSDETARKDLEGITHPEIVREIAKRVRGIRAPENKSSPPPKIIVVDAALLFESGLHSAMDKNILIRVEPELQMRRLIARDGLSVPEAEQRIQSQLPNDEKEKLAHYVIDNSGSPEETRRQVLGVLHKILTGHSA